VETVRILLRTWAIAVAVAVTIIFIKRFHEEIQEPTTHTRSRFSKVGDILVLFALYSLHLVFWPCFLTFLWPFAIAAIVMHFSPTLAAPFLALSDKLLLLVVGEQVYDKIIAILERLGL